MVLYRELFTRKKNTTWRCSWHQSSAHTGWLTGDCWAAKSLEMENKLFYSWTLYHLSFGFTLSHHSGTYSQREGQECWIFLLHPNATRQKRWKCDIWMSEKAASAGVFVAIRRLIYKIYGEITRKQEKKMAPGKIPTTFRITSQKTTIFWVFWWNKISFEDSCFHIQPDGLKQRVLDGTVPKFL